ncbi:hypothetical protein OHA70_09690 [Kribbella sp. NBC_00382]|uniref:hypothetical protein n=1 Tax=Kribbella sp. NBC_00382 TaxID=2975967 RepID=UPI002E1D54C7
MSSRLLRLPRGLPRPATKEERAAFYAARIAGATAKYEAELAERAAVAAAARTERTAVATADRTERAAVLDADRAEGKADLDADRASAAAFSDAIMTVAKGGIDRARASAEFVQKGATAIFALYTGALTLAFSVTDNPLPARGILPSLFLGFAILLATAYLAFLTRGNKVKEPADASGTPQAQLNRTRTFVAWTNTSVLNRAPLLRCAVVALGIGVVSLPAPFLTPPSHQPVASIVCSTGQEKDPTSGACLAAWPSVPTGTAADAPLRQKLYEAQLAEVTASRASARSGATAAPDDTSWVIAAAAIGLFLIFVPLLLAGLGIAFRKLFGKLKNAEAPGFLSTLANFSPFKW